MKLSGVKAMIGKVMAISLVAGAFALVAPGKAEAQQFGLGVRIGPSYSDEGRWDGYDRARYERQREAIAQHEAWERHQAWEQQGRWEHARERDRDRNWGYDRDRDREYDRDRERGHDRDRGQGGYAAPFGYTAPRGYYGR